MKGLKFLLTFFFSLPLFAEFSGAHAQTPDSVYFFDKEIVATASRIPTAFLKISRSITVLDQQTIRSLPVSNIADLLEYAAGVDVRQRGVNGVQADVSLRGATFEQTLIMIDGVKLYDPQTGHHNMNLPISLHDIEKVEILKGPGSRLFGPNAFGGVINIITKKPSPNSTFVSQTFGSYDLFETGAAVNHFQNRFSFYHGQSAGYQKNTDFRIWKGFYKSRLNFKYVNMDISAGYANKKFGANSFYTPEFTNQWENTVTGFFNSRSKFRTLSFNVTANIHWRHHIDNFLLDRKNPDFFENHHITDLYGVDLQASRISAFGISSFGFEFNVTKIRSDNLGKHHRNSQGIYFEHQKFFERLNIDFGAAAYRYSDWGWRFWPGIDVSYYLFSKTKIYFSVGRAFRIPTYTDLYYNSPQNLGNPDLREESCWNYETGYTFQNQAFLVTCDIFFRDSKDLIDWAWNASENLWKVENVNSLQTMGGEFSFNWRPESQFLKRIHFDYCYIISNHKNSYISKYLINYLRHNLTAKATLSALKDRLKISVAIRYQERNQFGSVLLNDIRLFWLKPNWEIFLEADNLFDRRYKDQEYVLLPGRWLKTGIIFRH